MDKSTKTLYEADGKKYIEEKQVFDILENLMRKLIINKPDDPLKFLINDIQNRSPRFQVFCHSRDTN